MELNRKVSVVKIVIISIVCALALGLFAFAYFDDKKTDKELENIDYIPQNNYRSFLIVGIDKFDNQITGEDEYRNDQLADFVILVVLNRNKKECTPIMINRDTMVYFDELGIGNKKIGDAYGQIALSYTYGSGDIDSLINTKNAVKKLLDGFPIDFYLSVTMDAVAVVNDGVGGVEVKVLDDFSGIDNELVMDENVTLKGQHALTYVRTRKGVDDQTNLSRMERQKQYLEALNKKAIDYYYDNNKSFTKLVLSVSDYINTNASINDITSFLDEIESFKMNDICMIEGENKKGEEFMEYYVGHEAVEKVLNKIK